MAFDEKLRNKMLLRVLLAASGVLLVLAAVIYLLARQMLVTELQQKSRMRVALAAVSINGWLREKSEMLEVVALRQGAGMLPEAERGPFFRQMCQRFGCIKSLYQGFEAGGAFFTGSDWQPPAGYDPRKRPWYRKAKAAGRTAFSKPYRDPYTKRLVVTIATPVRRGGRLQGMLAMDVFLDRIVTRVGAVRIGRGSYAYLVDDTGRVVAHPEAERVLETRIQQTDDAEFYQRFRQRSEGARQHAKDAGEDANASPSVRADPRVGMGADQAREKRPGKDRSAAADLTRLYEGDDYVTLSRIPESGWTLVFHLPRDEVNRPLGQLLLIFGVGVLLALTLLALTISYISQHIVRPIQNLTTEAGRIAEGDYDQHLEVSSRDEIGLLTRSFNEMAVGLKDRDFIKSTFGRYVSPDVMRDILSGNIELGGETTDLTILFSDIRGFTTLSEGMTPTDLVRLLNRYFSRMDDAIRQAGGAINKYLGDGILALYGAPQRLDNAAERAVESACSMLERLAELNADRRDPVAIGVGIHTGEAVVGNIGSESRTEYTVIGDAVNLASRIEALTRRYAQPILVSETTGARLSETWRLRTVDRVQVKGKRIPVTLYAPLRRAALDEAWTPWLDRSDAILQAYFDGRFGDALEAIAALAADEALAPLAAPTPADAPPVPAAGARGTDPVFRLDAERLDPLLRLIRERCQAYREATPEHWDGVFVHRSK